MSTQVGRNSPESSITENLQLLIGRVIIIKRLTGKPDNRESAVKKKPSL